mmetsp:Transcript_55096/g.133858  ORF Transcript_55096/g.133858 Transcript_55096/m.133858 type:complete len:596 (-) Transcript_55096:118-1905(-)
MIRSKGKNKDKKPSGSGGGGILGGMFKKKEPKVQAEEDGEDSVPAKKPKAGKKSKDDKDKPKKKTTKSKNVDKKKDVDPGGTEKSADGTAKKKKKKDSADAAGSAGAATAPPGGDADDDNQEPEIPEAFKDADPSKWRLRKYKFNGSARADAMGREEVVENSSIAKGVELFKENPGLYKAMLYQTSHLQRPESKQKYNLVHRKGTDHYRPVGVNPNGWMTMIAYDYIRLPPFKKNEFPMKWRDPWTDHMSYQGRLLHSETNKPIMPGRGMGILDKPNLKIIGDVDPSDIFQGSVGDCWLLSAISSLAEFDGAITRLFRKTEYLDDRPLDGPNQYTITLWDLPTMKEVDIVIDERLPVVADGTGKLLAGRPSHDGELWACYLEKAIAVHSGGWDKIHGGRCIHAWTMMTGCLEQYTIKTNPKTGKYYCVAHYNPKAKQWTKLYNCIHDIDDRMWRVNWPKVGGGGDKTKELTKKEMFKKMHAWDKADFIVGAGTADSGGAAGMVDDHTYTVIEAHANLCGTGINLFKVRNPWGKGEVEDGQFDDDGPGWDEYPEIKAYLKPVVADDGIFYVTVEEFFEFFDTVYVCAKSMTEFKED